MPNFIEIGQTSLEIGVGRKKNSTHTHIHTHDTRHPDWLSDSKVTSALQSG